MSSIVASCTFMAENIKPVENFDVDAYLGKWYEIARMDFKHERNLNQVTAEYSKNDDGSIKVINKGYDYVKEEWKTTEGKAKFRHEDTLGMLKVSFFGPFYSGYNVIEVDSNYQYALVTGKNTDYMWILARTTTIPENVKEEYLQKAQEVGYDIEKLVWVEHKE